MHRARWATSRGSWRRLLLLRAHLHAIGRLPSCAGGQLEATRGKFCMAEVRHGRGACGLWLSARDAQPGEDCIARVQQGERHQSRGRCRHANPERVCRKAAW